MARASIRVAAVQLLTRSDVQDNLRQVLQCMHEAREAGCAVIAFHEGALTGYPCEAEVEAIDFQRVVDAERQVQALAGSLGLAVLLGSTSRREGGQLFNDVLIIDEAGQPLGRYAKTWRAGEAHYTAGSGPVIFTVAGVQATAIICHDLRFPELVRLPVIAGARLLFIINNESGILHEHKQLGYRSMQIARATENGIYAVMANAAADPAAIDGSHQSHGQSKIIDPMGNVLDEAGVFENRLVIADLDLRQATAEPALRTVGQAENLHARYTVHPEHTDYARWMNEGLALVQRFHASANPKPTAPSLSANR